MIVLLIAHTFLMLWVGYFVGSYTEKRYWEKINKR
jgi:uncharacterized membrane protein